MRPRELLIYLTAMALVVELAFVSGKLAIPFSESQFTSFAVAICLGTIAALIGVRFFTQRAPIPLTISVLGLPGSGKTVYITSLFGSLQSYRSPKIRFVPYGIETIEAVAKNMSLLTSGEWLPRTSPGSVFPFKAGAEISSFLLERRFRIEIDDYAGEHMGELVKGEPEWLHRTEYFSYVIQSDAIILAIDSARLIQSDPAECERIQNSYIAALQVLAEQKGATESRKLRAPLALVFLKTDFLIEMDVNASILEFAMKRLIDTCFAYCRRVKVFHVSSVGVLDSAGAPHGTLSPINVIDPLIWILAQSTYIPKPAGGHSL